MQSQSTPRVCKKCGSEFPEPPRQKSVDRPSFARFCPDCRYRNFRGDPVARLRAMYRHADTGCWILSGPVNAHGYGTICVEGKRQYCHRYSYELTHGPIPNGLHVLHNCPGGDNPSCVNPEHLYLGTQADNNADAQRKGQAAFGERIGNARLTEPEVLDIRIRYAAGGIRQRDLAQEYGVHQTTIMRVVRRMDWRHI